VKDGFDNPKRDIPPVYLFNMPMPGFNYSGMAQTMAPLGKTFGKTFISCPDDLPKEAPFISVGDEWFKPNALY
jgi:hypothetical protein